MMDRREFTNGYLDYSGESLLKQDGQLADTYGRCLKSNINRLLRRLYRMLDETEPDGDYSVYTGSSGLGYLHLHLATTMSSRHSQEYLMNALDYIEPTLPHLRKQKSAFLCGDGGPLALGAVIYHRLGQKNKSLECVKRLTARHTAVVTDQNTSDELMNGRAGYLYALLYVQSHLGAEVIEEYVIDKVFKAIVMSGQAYSKKEKSLCELLYKWHGKKYMGAAHGFAGIFYVLMQVKNPEYRSYLDLYVKPSIDFLMNLKFPSGNYPSSIGSTSGDKLVHWCHGAGGWIQMFIAAYELYKDNRYLDEALSCAEVLWSRGLLRKGYGLCHGVAGNGYGFLAIYRVTQDPKYLYRALKFAEFCFEYGKHGCRIPDHPESLFEGLAGTIHFMADLLRPHQARFPGYEL